MTASRALSGHSLSSLCLLLPLVGVLACGGSPPPSGKGAVIVAGGKGDKVLDAQGQPMQTPHLENKEDFDKFSFACCKTPAGTALVGAYVDLGEKLAADDGAGAGATLGSLATAADAAAAETALAPEAQAQAQAIAAAARGLKGKDLAALRQELPAFGLPVIDFARSQTGGEQKLVAAFCPMAPGHWLQRSGAIRNPYYGSDMLTCGTLEAAAEAR